MKKDFVLDQVITIKIPADPTRPAVVVFTAGPYSDEAKRLAAIPGSGWQETLLARAVEPITDRMVYDGAALATIADNPPRGFCVDRRLLTPKPLRKPRPDASKRMSAYNEAKKAAPTKEPLGHTPAADRRTVIAVYPNGEVTVDTDKEKHTMDFKKYKEELMKNPEFTKAYEDLGPEMDDIQSALEDLRSAIDEELREALAEAEQAPAPTKK